MNLNLSIEVDHRLSLLSYFGRVTLEIMIKAHGAIEQIITYAYSYYYGPEGRPYSDQRVRPFVRPLITDYFCWRVVICVRFPPKLLDRYLQWWYQSTEWTV